MAARTAGGAAGRACGTVKPGAALVRRWALPAVLAALAAVVAIRVYWVPPGRGDLPREIEASPLPAIPDRPRIVAMGTSLTARYDWPDRTARLLEACLGSPVDLTVIAGSGKTSAWGQDQIPALIAARPDLVVMEFTANDADLRRGIGPARSDALHGAILAALRDAHPQVRVLLLGMNPSFRLRGALRWRETRYLSDYAARAGADPRVGYFDLAPDWAAEIAGAGQAAVLPDGLHPKASAAGRVIPAALAGPLGRIFGVNCG